MGTTLVLRACGRYRRPLNRVGLPLPTVQVQGVEAACGRTKTLGASASTIPIASHPS